MGTESTLISVAVILEEDADEARRIGYAWSTEEEIRKAVLAAIAVLVRNRPHARVEWSSLSSIPLDGRPHCGRCAVCNRWVYDAESRSDDTPTGICQGAIVEDRLLCDDHLPKDHPLAF
jgi:hypothetical protein